MPTSAYVTKGQRGESLQVDKFGDLTDTQCTLIEQDINISKSNFYIFVVNNDITSYDHVRW